MSTIDPIADAVKAPARKLPSSDLRKTWVDNPRAELDLAYGNRAPTAQGYAEGHDHGEQGGVHLGMHLFALAFGPYTQGSGTTFPGVPICAPLAGLAFDTEQAKLIAPAPVLIPAGVTGVHLDLVVIPELSSSPQSLTLGVVLRPLGLLNYNDFRGDVAEADFLYGHLRKSTFSIATTDPAKKIRVTFADLSRLGSATRPRRAELCFFICSNLTGGNVVHLCAVSALASAVTTQVREAELGDAPDDRVSPATILSGQSLTTGLSGAARRATNQAPRAALGGTPGYRAGQVSPARPFVQRLTRAHRHTGAEIARADGTVESDGAVFTRLLYAESRVTELGETGTNRFDDFDPPKGQRIHRSGTLAAEWRRYPARISLCPGIRRFRYGFALRAETAVNVNALEVYLWLGEIGAAISAATNLLGAIDGGGQLDASGYLYTTANPTDTPGFKPTGPRLAQGLGVWTKAAEAPAATLPPGVLAANRYRASEELELAVRDDVTLADRDYILEARFACYASPSIDTTVVDTGARLVWACAYYLE